MSSVPLVEQYAILKSRGLTPLAALVDICRSRPGFVSWILEWFALHNPDAGAFRDRWLKSKRAEAREWKMMVGSVDEGCYHYTSFSHRTYSTVFIKWEQVENIYIADSQDWVSLELYSHGPHRHKEVQAHPKISGFGPLLQEVSQRFFGARDYLEGKFRRGAYRKLRVWPDEQIVAPAPPNSRPTSGSPRSPRAQSFVSLRPLPKARCYFEQPVAEADLTRIDGKFVVWALWGALPYFCVPGLGHPIMQIAPLFRTVLAEMIDHYQAEQDSYVTKAALWHDPAEGLRVIRPMLQQFRAKEIVLPDQPPDLRDGIVRDLAAIEHALVAAERNGIRFYLDVVWS